MNTLPPEIQTEAEKLAYCRGWWDALEARRKWWDNNKAQRTHSEDCYKWHHECAVAKIERGMK